STEGGRKKKRETKKTEKKKWEKREKKNLESVDPSPAVDFFSSRGEKKRLPAGGEGMRRRRLDDVEGRELSKLERVSSVTLSRPQTETRDTNPDTNRCRPQSRIGSSSGVCGKLSIMPN
ncbi:hypothetical protein BHE74_00033440, partial [Ensete ventricosum]